MSQVQFGPFTLASDPNRLLRGDEPIKLRPMSQQVLRYLSERPGQFVSKEELLERVWTGRVISDSGLRLCVREIRAALDDDAKNPHYLETVTGRGYRFLQGQQGRTLTIDQPLPMVGREAELEQLLNCYQQAKRGSTQFVVIGGEPGIGKTTLLEAFRQQIDTGQSGQIIEGQCVVHYGKGEAYGPVLEAINAYCQGPSGKEVIRLLERLAPGWLLQLPGLIDASDFARVQRQVEGMSSERMLREFNQAVAELAQDSPIIITIEDLHWADIPTIDLLASLTGQGDTKLMIVGTYRPADAVLYRKNLRDTIKELRGRGQCIEVMPELLPREQVVSYLETRLNGKISTALVDTIFSRSNGNPLFLITLVEEYIRSQALRQQEGQWVDASEDFTGIVPESLKSLILRNLEALSESDRMLLETASIVGLEFSAAAIADTLEQTLDQVDVHCETLANAGQFIETDKVEEWPDSTLSGRYRFRHPLYLEVIYEQIGEGRRARLHRSVGLRLEAGYGDQASDIAPGLAAHFDRGRDLEKCLHFRKLAAEQALGRHAYVTAIDQLRIGLEKVELLPESTERNRLELELLMILGPILIVTQGYTSTDLEQSYDRARVLCQQLDDAVQHFATMWNLAAYRMARGELHQSRTLIEQAVEAVRNLQNEDIDLLGEDALAQQCFFEGRFAEAHEKTKIVLSRYDPDRHAALAESFGQEDPAIACASMDAVGSCMLGHFDQSLERLQTVKELSAQIENPYARAYGLNFLTMTHQLRADFEATLQHANELIELCARFNVHWLPAGLVFQGWANMHLDPRPEHLETAQSGLGFWRDARVNLFAPYLMALVAEIQSKMGEDDAACELIAESIALVEKNQEGWTESEIHCIQGDIFARRGMPLAEIESCYLRALEIAREQQTYAMMLRSGLKLAELWKQRGESAKTMNLLSPIVDWFDVSVESPELEAARNIIQSSTPVA